jgi:MMP 1-O-methyltransferase
LALDDECGERNGEVVGAAFMYAAIGCVRRGNEMFDINKFKHDIETLHMVRFLDSVPGFLDLLEGFTLMSLAEMPGYGVIVEIGSFKGKSTCWLAYGCKRRGGGQVVAVDHFRGSSEHQKGGIDEIPEIVAGLGTRAAFDLNVARFGFSDYIAVREGDSADVSGWSAPIRLLFIDGDHSYVATKRDFEAWRPFVMSGGLICFHDYMQPHAHLQGVTEFIDREISTAYHVVMKIQSLLVIQVP